MNAMTTRGYPCHVCGDLLETEFPTMWTNNKDRGGCHECGRMFTHEWAKLRSMVRIIEKERR